MGGALSGIRVLDLSRILAGPYCTQTLADLGAEVWKVEAPWGDDTRRWGPPFSGEESAYYLATNRGKKGLAVDLRQSAGQTLVRELSTRADVLVENFKVGDLQRYGLDYENLSRGNPRLIYVSITGYGHSGPRAEEAGYDAALQAMTGLMSITGEPDGSPMKLGVAWIDVLTGLSAAFAVVTALLERERSRMGQWIDLSLYEVGLAALVNQAQGYLLDGEVPQRQGTGHPQIVPYQAFAASDGWFVVAVGNDAQFARLAALLERSWLAEDARFATNASRVANRAALVSQLAESFAGGNKEQWIARCRAAGIPAAPVNTVADAFTDPQVGARNAIWTLLRPELPPLAMPASPFQHFSRTPAHAELPPPRLGEHTAEVLGKVLGRSPGEVAALAAAGVVVVAPERDLSGRHCEAARQT
ncbi:MAG: CoA transferase [Candidatus Schekmanbacteria bacterium]|nr:CoA transferase [Candidatus Schekmanbacteria bacterium]